MPDRAAPSPPSETAATGDRWWLVPVVVAAAVGVAVVLGLAVSFGPSADDFVGVWVTGEGGDGISLTVTQSEDGLQARLPDFGFEGGDLSAPATVEGDVLVFEYASDPGSDTAPSLSCRAVLEDPDTMRLTIAGIEEAPGMMEISMTMILTRVEAREPSDTPVAPTPSSSQP